eukprot:TRINITY_DN2658_c0_g1_i2.p1 TRINITY_DN2658_c0_g1~~TRINITY_DN2658_c0_g1_i2.p1  ORF type:complete len:532 (+),score=183.37 TRINITY_DN2658_c0_g1_i2:79-1596(+)
MPRSAAASGAATPPSSGAAASPAAFSHATSPPGGAASVDAISAPGSAGSLSANRRASRRPSALPQFSEVDVAGGSQAPPAHAAAAAPPAPPAPQPAGSAAGLAADDEPEPSVDGLDCGDLGEDNTAALLADRIVSLDSAADFAASERQYARAWRLQEERTRLERMRGRIELFDSDIAEAEQRQRQAVAQGDFLQAESLKDHIAFLRRERRAEVQCDYRILTLELNIIDCTTANDEHSQQYAAQLREEVAATRAQRAAVSNIDAQCTELRRQARAAAFAEDYTLAARLKQQEEELGRSGGLYHPQYPPREPSPPPAAPGRFAPAQPRPAAPRVGAMRVTGADALGPLFAPLQASPRRPLTGPDPAAPQHSAAAPRGGSGGGGALAGDAVVSQLAAMIWESSRSQHGGAPGAAQPAGEAVDPVARRRLMSFYQHYNPSKLPSVARCLREYRGHEEKLFEALVQKYGPEPPDQLAAALPHGWRLVEGPTGDCFYLHEDGRKQWERPAA